MMRSLEQMFEQAFKKEQVLCTISAHFLNIFYLYTRERERGPKTIFRDKVVKSPDLVNGRLSVSYFENPLMRANMLVR